MTRLGGCSIVLTVFALGLPAAVAQGVSASPQLQVRLTASEPVYKRGSAGGVQFTLTNGTSQTLIMSTPNPWSIYRGSQAVFSPISIMVLGQIAPGKSKTWSWNMKDMSGKLVPPGSYTIKVGQLWLGNDQFARSITVAVTPTGKIAGSSPFPLALDNEWGYVAGPGLFGGPGSYSTTTVVSNSGTWYSIKNVVGKDRWAKLSGGSKPTLFVMAKVGGDGVMSVPFFRFNRPLGYTYTVLGDALAGPFHQLGGRDPVFFHRQFFSVAHLSPGNQHTNFFISRTAASRPTKIARAMIA